MHIRFANMADVEEIYTIYCPYIEKTTITFETKIPTLKEFRKRFDRITAHYPWLVVEENGVLLGYAYASRAFARAAYDWCVDLAIYFRMDCAHHGAARRLYEALLQLLFRQQVRIVYALITAENERSIHFHERMGFHEVGILKESGYKFGKWLDVVWMEKTLYAPRDPLPFRPINEVVSKDERENLKLEEETDGSDGSIDQKKKCSCI